jgi:hypothetical protein
MMKWTQTIDRNCASCHGRGEVLHVDQRGDEIWTTSMTCHCVSYVMDDEMRGFLRAVSAMSSTSGTKTP